MLSLNNRSTKKKKKKKIKAAKRITSIVPSGRAYWSTWPGLHETNRQVRSGRPPGGNKVRANIFRKRVLIANQNESHSSRSYYTRLEAPPPPAQGRTTYHPHSYIILMLIYKGNHATQTDTYTTPQTWTNEGELLMEIHNSFKEISEESMVQRANLILHAEEDSCTWAYGRHIGLYW